MIKPWKKQHSTPRGDYRVFTVREDLAEAPRDGSVHSFFVIESSDWVNVIPLTPEGKLVLVEQYRHGTEEISLEIPGGLIDPGETPAEAARREMHEETGYDTNDIVYLGTVAPNPALQNNRCHSYLARNVVPTAAQHLDPTEDIAVRLVDPADVPGLIAEGTISHALVVAAFYFHVQQNG